MTPLGERMRRLIAASGPIGVADYMTACLFDPQHGYYTTREPFGRAGDFVTAPEISQMFGELVAVWLFQAWRAGGSPLPATIAEIGPGRGTLMKDMARTVRRLAPNLAAGADFALVEASPRLAAVQKEMLAEAGPSFAWHATVDTLPCQPLFIVGNEIFDALPFRQFVRTEARWIERAIDLDEDGRLRFTLGNAVLPDDALPPQVRDAPAGAVFETAPAREALMSTIAEHVAGHGGSGIFFDYGHLAPSTGDTFQAVRRHRSEDVFAAPGEADLTSHVDFAALAAVARSHGLETQATTQGEFLLGMGLLERAGRLGEAADDAARERIVADVERLAGPDQMGDLFKVLTIRSPGTVQGTRRSDPGR